MIYIIVLQQIVSCLNLSLVLNRSVNFYKFSKKLCKFLFFSKFISLMKVHFSGADDEYLNFNALVISENEFIENNLNTLHSILDYIFKIEPRSHKSFFKNDGTLANGTICLLDDIDASITADENITSDSNVVLISTLHGG